MSHFSTPGLDTSIPQELSDLNQAIGRLSGENREALEPHLRRVIEASHRRKKVLQLVQEALSQLRMDMKYLMFDLEATRRERDGLQEQLDRLSE